MYKLNKEQIRGSEREYVCLKCGTQFMQFDSVKPVCPRCRAKGPDSIVVAKEMALDEDADIWRR